MLSLTKIPNSSSSSSSKSKLPPSHHVYANTAAPEPKPASSWSSYLLSTSWLTTPSPSPPPPPPQPSSSSSSSSSSTPTSFRNPWASWHKPTKSEKWASFAWGADDDPSISLALTHLATSSSRLEEKKNKKKKNHPPTGTGIGTGGGGGDGEGSSGPRPNFDLADPDGPGAQASRLLGIQKPDFSLVPTDTKTRLKATWLGHASVFVQVVVRGRRIPDSGGDGAAGDGGTSSPTKLKTFNCLFDPIFSARASPSAYAGPIRSYQAPCQVEDLPEEGVDAVFISHNHYDHMDESSLVGLWERYEKKGIRFFVPLGNGKILKQMGIDGERVVEMDWWDGVKLDNQNGEDQESVKIWCVPAQHNSGRIGVNRDECLWSGWVVETESSRVFFAGDTGYQFHGDPKWPPVRDEDEEPKEEEYPACPAFKEVRDRIGRPDLVLLPISVGATFAYLKSFVPLPDSVSPFPRHSAGVMGANHMPPWDAVRVLKEVAAEGEGYGKGREIKRTVAMGIHWGTFVTDPSEVLKTLGQLEYACKRQGVRYARQLEEGGGRLGESTFVVVNHGESVCL